jgi:hypothetical protein
MVRNARLEGAVLAVWIVAVATAGAQANPAIVGEWAPLQTIPVEAVHATLLPTGKVLLWPTYDSPHLWDPATGAVSASPQTGYNVFCSGHSLLPDGRLFVAGGHIQNNVGEDRATIYDPATGSWTAVAARMNDGRWYPTNTTLANGDVLVTSGDADTTTGVNTLPQVWQFATGTWRSLSAAVLGLPLYPWMYLAPNGRVFYAGPTARTRYLDSQGAGAWTDVAQRSLPGAPGTADAFRDYGSSVVYDVGKILVVGGGDPPTSAAQVIDLTVPTPAWQSAGAMSVARRQLNTTLLPDGTVLVTGGTSAATFNDVSGATYHAELWDPATATWSRMAAEARPRLYHSTALLLPDGRVLSAGGDYTTSTGQFIAEQNLQVYSPPYLFTGAVRPSIGSAPSRVTYDETFVVDTPEAIRVTQVTWLRLGAVTHAFNQEQRINRLAFVRPLEGNALTVTAPRDTRLTPPGYYMLFVLVAGVPSTARIVRLEPDIPTLASLTPSSAVSGDPGLTLIVTGDRFVDGSVVKWNGAPKPTQYVSATELRASIASADLGAPGTVAVAVQTPGDATSAPLTFTVKPRLTVMKVGTGIGTVTSTPGGVACGSDCTEGYPSGTTVTLTATVAPGSRFRGWSGGGCKGASASCTVKLNADTIVQATFAPR